MSATIRMTGTISGVGADGTTLTAPFDITVPGTVTPPDPTPPDPPVTTGRALTIQLGGKSYVFAQEGGHDLGDYHDPQGRFIQHCIAATNPDLPHVTVMFRPDVAGGREEIVVEYGAVWPGANGTNYTPQNLAAYTATFAKDGTTLATVSAPCHYYFSRWRWQSAERPVTAKTADLIAAGLLPHFDKAANGGQVPSVAVSHYAGPMDLAGLCGYGPTTGERDDIGIVTEQAANYLCTGDAAALASLRAQLEASGTEPWHYRDEQTGAPLDIFEYPNATSYSPNGANPYLPIAWTYCEQVQPDTAHGPDLGYVAFLLTGDPYALEALQFTATFNHVSQSLGYRNYDMSQVRAHAWSLRTSAHCVHSTPDTVPSWLKPKAYWKKNLDGNRDYMMSTRVNSKSLMQTRFHASCPDDGAGSMGEIAALMEELDCAVIGHVAEMGFTDWLPILDWKVQCHISRADGKSGWNRSTPVPYQWVVRHGSATGPYAQDWQTSWQWNIEAGTVQNSDPAHLLSGCDLTYPSYIMGAMAIASRLGITAAEAPRAWLQQEINARGPASIRAKWSIL